MQKSFGKIIFSGKITFLLLLTPVGPYCWKKQRGKEIYKLPFSQREATNTFASNRRGKERSDRNVHPRIKSFSELVKIEFTTGQSYSLNFIARILVKLPDQQYLPFLVVHRNTHLGILTFALTTVYVDISSSSVKLFDI